MRIALASRMLSTYSLHRRGDRIRYEGTWPKSGGPPPKYMLSRRQAVANDLIFLK